MGKYALAITIVCWNIQYGQNYNKILANLKNGLSSDILILQEVDKNTARTENRNIAGELANDLKMNYVWSEEFLELSQSKGRGPKAYTGQAVLSKYEIKLLKNLYFSSQPVSWTPSIFNPRSWVQPRLGKRMAQIVELTIANQKIIIANTHLESSLADKKIVPQMEELLNYLYLNHANDNTIIAGDLNTWAGSESPVIKILEDYGYKNSYPIRSEGRSLDWIFYKGHDLEMPDTLTIRRDVTATDHFPLQLRLQIQNNL